MNTSFQGTTEKGTETWLTPPEYIEALGPFDLDPATPPEMPWNTAANRYTKKDNGLIQPWYGRVWLNPPYGRKGMDEWLKKMVSHGNGIALVYASTDVEWFDHIWEADALLFKRGRVKFYDETGKIPVNDKGDEKSPGKGSVFAAYGDANRAMLWKAHNNSIIPGKYLRLK